MTARPLLRPCIRLGATAGAGGAFSLQCSRRIMLQWSRLHQFRVSAGRGRRRVSDMWATCGKALVDGFATSSVLSPHYWLPLRCLAELCQPGRGQRASRPRGGGRGQEPAHGTRGCAAVLLAAPPSRLPTSRRAFAAPCLALLAPSLPARAQCCCPPSAACRRLPSVPAATRAAAPVRAAAAAPALCGSEATCACTTTRP